MAQPRPSLLLVLDIDARLDSEDLRLEINRSYSYVGSTYVRTHESRAAEPSNTARMSVNLGTKRYLALDDESSNELWNDCMERWFYNAFHRIGNNMKIFNRRQRDIGESELIFDQLDIDLENGAVHAIMRLDSTSGIDPSANTYLTSLRQVLGEGTLGEGVVNVLMPSPSSFIRQQEAGAASKAEREHEEAERREAERTATIAQREAAEMLADEAFLESPALLARSTDDCAQPKTVTEMSGVDNEAAFALPEPDFAIDYSVWAIEYVDGSVREFDSTTGCFLESGAAA